MQKIKEKIVRSDGIGIFHDSRGDILKLTKMVNLLIDKVNELIEENNKLKDKTNL
jgi:hypothetical protein